MAIKAEKGYQRGLLGVDIIFHEDRFNQGLLHFTFGEAILNQKTGKYEIGKKNVVGILKEDMPLGFSNKIQDVIAEEMSKGGKELNDKYGQIFEQGLGDYGRTNENTVIKAGTEMLVFGFFAYFAGDHYEKIKGKLGSIERPACMCIPNTHRHLMSLPYDASKINMDWLPLNGANTDITDIDGDVLVKRIFHEKVQGSSPRNIMIVR